MIISSWGPENCANLTQCLKALAFHGICCMSRAWHVTRVTLTVIQLIPVHNVGYPWAIGAVSVINHYYGRDDIRLGAFKGQFGSSSSGVLINFLTCYLYSWFRTLYWQSHWLIWCTNKKLQPGWGCCDGSEEVFDRSRGTYKYIIIITSLALTCIILSH